MAKIRRPRGRRRRHETDVSSSKSAAAATPVLTTHTKTAGRASAVRSGPLDYGQSESQEQSRTGGEKLPPPLALEELPLSMASALAAHGFSTPTVVQSRCWPICLSGRDMLCIAPTGSGKTLGYALPLLDLARRWATPTPATLALFLLPTRELARQVLSIVIPIATAVVMVWPSRIAFCVANLTDIYRLPRQVTGVMEQLLGSSPWTVHAVYGGVDRKQQRQQLKQCAPPTVLVATPGRLLDLAGGISNDGVVAETLVGGADGGTGHNGAPMTTCVSLGLVRYLAIDEADKLLSLGLGEQARPPPPLSCVLRQRRLCSADVTDASLRTG